MRQQQHDYPRRELADQRRIYAFKVVAILNWVVYATAILYRLHSAEHGELKHYLGMSSDQVLREFWLWQLVTYVFLHDNSFLLILNSIILWIASAELEMRWGAWKFLFFYLVSALGGGILSCLLADKGEAFGASGAVMAVLLAGAILFPERVYFGVLRARHMCWLALLTQVIACLFLYEEKPDTSFLRKMPHAALVFGGLAAGWMFIRTEPSLSRATYVWLRRRDIRRKREMVKIRRKVDELLEKIKVIGLNQLSRKERAFLLRASRLFQKEISSESEYAHRE